MVATILQSNEHNGFLYDESQGITVISSSLLDADKKKKPFTRKPFIATFKVMDFLGSGDLLE